MVSGFCDSCAPTRAARAHRFAACLFSRAAYFVRTNYFKHNLYSYFVNCSKALLVFGPGHDKGHKYSRRRKDDERHFTYLTRYLCPMVTVRCYSLFGEPFLFLTMTRRSEDEAEQPY